METTRAERIRLGIFILLTLLLVIGTVAFIIGKELMERNTPYFTRFTESVDGLNLGAKVKLNGITIGQVTQILVDPEDLNTVLVRFDVNSEFPIKTGMEANLVGGMSLTGLKTIELTGGLATEANVEWGGYVKAGTSSLKQLTGQAETLALKTEMIMNNLINMTSDQNAANLGAFLRNLNQITARTDSLLRRNETTLNAIPGSALHMIQKANTTLAEVEKAQLGQKLSQSLAGVDQAVGRFDQVIADLSLEKTLVGVQKATQSIEILSKRADQTVYRNQEDLSIAVRHLREAMENLNDVSRQVRENPSLLIRGEEKQQRMRR